MGRTVHTKLLVQIRRYVYLCVRLSVNKRQTFLVKISLVGTRMSVRLFGNGRTISCDHDTSKTVRYKYLKFGKQDTHKLNSTHEFSVRIGLFVFEPIHSKGN